MYETAVTEMGVSVRGFNLQPCSRSGDCVLLYIGAVDMPRHSKKRVWFADAVTAVRGLYGGAYYEDKEKFIKSVLKKSKKQ